MSWITGKVIVELLKKGQGVFLEPLDPLPASNKNKHQPIDKKLYTRFVMKEKCFFNLKNGIS
jgi:hypothetical protein